jgi:hypothetical protein
MSMIRAGMSSHKELKPLLMIKLFDRKNNHIRYIFRKEMNKQLDVLVEELSESSTDREREEMLWTSRNQDLLQKWAKECKCSSQLHRTKAKRYKKLYAAFGLPAVIIPTSLGVIQPYIQDYPLATSIAMVVSGVISGTGTFFDFSKKRMEHDKADNDYNELFLVIESILAKPKRNRQACDVVMCETLFKFNHINSQSPSL